MKRAWIAALLNFFFAGLGYVVLGERRLLGLGWTVAAVGLTYVELSVQTAAPALYWPMFASVFVLNTCFAVDAFQVGRRLASGSAEVGAAAVG
ncbi:MAG: hypothetical protein KC619_16465 [Myxococcales bacterium]|nr:hypothetical protein [Myxococcales bacterium]